MPARTARIWTPILARMHTKMTSRPFFGTASGLPTTVRTRDRKGFVLALLLRCFHQSTESPRASRKKTWCPRQTPKDPPWILNGSIHQALRELNFLSYLCFPSKWTNKALISHGNTHKIPSSTTGRNMKSSKMQKFLHLNGSKRNQAFHHNRRRLRRLPFLRRPLFRLNSGCQ